MHLPKLFASVVVGLDVQQDAVRLVKMERKSREFCIRQLAVVYYQHHVFKGEIVEKWDALRAAVTEVAIVAGLRNEPVITNLPVFIPGIDFNAWVAERQDYILRYERCMREAGMNLKVIDLDVLARERSTTVSGIKISDQLEKYNDTEMNKFAVATGLAVREW